ncbi:MAG: cytidylate kinase-like family protein [Spirochaetaceae bacterium]|jgi:cytidylate kinase|nr:cytidylate kinase-like family protein [Spirochaetaceae bacterium]
MAVITISRQVAALGDEIASALAKELGYTFIDRKMIESRLLTLGFPEEKLKKYDEKKPGFFASLAKDRDEYLDYLQTAVLEAAGDNNCILIGRGAFVILDSLPNRVAVRFIADNTERLARLMREFNWDEKQAQARIDESDANRFGFHKSFFNLVNEDPTHFHMILNTAQVDIVTAVTVIAALVKLLVTPEKEAAGKAKVESLLRAQRLVNTLIFEHKLNINFLSALINGNTVVLQGVADSAALSEKAVAVASSLMPGCKVESAISIVQDFKSYP